MIAFTDLPDLTTERLGGAVIAANDEFFADRHNLLKPGPAVFRPDEYTDRGKWMDGWETRRRRDPGYDWCIVRLGLPGVVRGVVVDTAHFIGNFPEACSIDVTELSPQGDLQSALDPGTPWRSLLSRSALRGDTANTFAASSETRVSHLRLNIFPDGGVARLRVFGEVSADWRTIRERGGEVDLAAIQHGGLVIGCSDMFFGSRHNLIMPGRSAGMHDGWETRRRRGPGHDWAVIRLGTRGHVHRVDVDTTHFKGNAPGWCSVDLKDSHEEHDPSKLEAGWHEAVPKTALQPHSPHVFEVSAGSDARFVRLNIYPDGGVSRVRVWGTPDGGV